MITLPYIFLFIAIFSLELLFYSYYFLIALAEVINISAKNVLWQKIL